MSQQIKSKVRQFYNVFWNQHNISDAQLILHEDVIFRGSLGDEKRGIDGFAEYVDKVHFALADYHCEILELVSEDNKVFAKMYFSGIHRNEFMGFAGSHKKLGWHGAALFTFNSDKISEIWVLGDLKSLEQQLRDLSD